jgi:hypothetical protein
MHGGHLGPPCPFFRFAKYELSDLAGGLAMKKLLLKAMIAATVGTLLFAIPAATQVSPTTRKAAHVRIKQGPEIERADPDFAIIRWTSNNPGGSPEHAVRMDDCNQEIPRN